MLCETCRWTGRPGFVRAPGNNQEGPCAMIPCPDCGGQGIAHCCDGICEQPHPEAKKEPIPDLGERPCLSPVHAPRLRSTAARLDEDIAPHRVSGA
jgi:hypothetical protein